MKNTILYRKRFIPNEKVCLKDDEIVLIENDIIVTKWKTLKPRKDLSHGASCYFLKEGFKVSKFIDVDGNLLFWYCDIITYSYDEQENTYIFDDLLIDVKVYPDGFVEVIDIDEVAEALDQKLLDIETVKYALTVTDKLLKIIYSGEFDNYKKYIEDI